MADNDKFSSFEGMALARNSDGAFEIGEFKTSNHNTSFALDKTTRPFALDICADDGGTALTAAAGTGDNCAPIRARMLVRTDVASQALCVFGVHAQLKIASSVSSTGKGSAGLMAYLEVASAGTIVGDFAAIRAIADVDGTQTSGVVSAIMLDSVSLGGTTSGTTACIYIPNPDSGTWDYFLQTGSAPGFYGSTITKTVVSNGTLKVCIGGSVHYIPVTSGTS
jgi:hypothetical protein